MDYQVKQVLTEFSTQLDGYHALLLARLMNLVVKSNPYALLPVVVEADGGERVFEEVADLAIPDDDHLEVYPKLEEHILVIGRGCLEVHPEFKMEEATYKHGNDDVHFLRFTMPKVDKDRRDVLEQGVKVFYDEAKVQVEACKAKYQPRLAEKIVSVPKEDSDKAKEQFDNTYDNILQIMKDLVDDKNKEIEEAYQRYLKEQVSAGQVAQEEEAAQGVDVKSQLIMPTAE